MTDVAIRDEVVRGFERMRPNLVAVLPSYISADKFERTALTAITMNPDLMNANRRTLFLACQRCAQDGLLPDGREAVLVVYKTKIKRQGGGEEWIDAVQYQPMVGGIIKKVRQSGDVVELRARVVFEKDEFAYEYGDDERIVHKPHLGADRGKPIAAYAIAKLRDGSTEREVMPLDQIEKARASSKVPGDNGPWGKWWDEMARKTVMKRLAKRLPISTENLRAINSEDEPDTVELPPMPARPKLEDFAEVDAKSAAAELDHQFADTLGKPDDGGTGHAVNVQARAAGPACERHDAR